MEHHQKEPAMTKPSLGPDWGESARTHPARTDRKNHVDAVAFCRVATIVILLSAVACGDEPVAVEHSNASDQQMPQASVVGSPVDRVEIQQIVNTFDRTWGVDPVTYAAQYAGADWVGPFGEILNTDQVRALYESIFPAFAATTRHSQIRSLAFLTGTIAVLNLDVRVTGTLPPFVTPWQPGVVRALEKNILIKHAGTWRIIEHQQILPAPGV
jgi:hypothetical protein